MQKIDFHTHQIRKGGNIQILNVFAQDLYKPVPEFLFTAGLHPWHIGMINPEECLQAIEQSIPSKNMIAVGECGLDRSISTDFAIQKNYFNQQILIAEKHHKPLIIHCVRALSDLAQLKKETKSGIPWIIHGYQGNQEATLNLIRQGFYFSVGEKLLKNESKHAIFKTIPIERLFLETDDQQISIDEVYSMAAQIRKVDEEMLVEILFNNFTYLFGNAGLET